MSTITPPSSTNATFPATHASTQACSPRSFVVFSVTAVAAAVFLALSGCSNSFSATTAAAPASTDATASAPATARPVAVGVQVLQSAAVAVSTELPGRTSAPLVAEIRPQVGGIVQTRRFAGGEQVRAGQVLFQIDPATYQAAVASAQAAVSKAQATVDADQLTATRRSELAAIGAASTQDKQDADAALKLAQADLASASAALATARINLQRSTITSPIDGVVDVPAVTPGALVSADQASALTTVRQVSTMQVDVTQSSADVLRLKADLAAGRLHAAGKDGATVKLLLEDGSTYAHTGRLSFSGVAVNASTGAVTLRALFSNPQGLLMPGMYVRAVLQTGVAEQAIVVPQQALARDAGGGASVLVVNEQSQVQRKTVVAERAVGNGWLISSGLKAGERVVVEGSQKVKPGDTVQAQVLQAQAANAATNVALK
jgi:membrane fusion protein (multidrug efflux system)